MITLRILRCLLVYPGGLNGTPRGLYPKEGDLATEAQVQAVPLREAAVSQGMEAWSRSYGRQSMDSFPELPLTC